MTKILNLSELSPNESRELVINGTTHKVRETSVEDFIENELIAKKLEGETGLAVQLDATMSMVSRLIPTLSKEELSKMSLEQLHAITAFVRGVDPEEILKAVATEQEASAEAGDEKK